VASLSPERLAAIHDHLISIRIAPHLETSTHGRVGGGVGALMTQRTSTKKTEKTAYHSKGYWPVDPDSR